jgi:hypothetical protein
MILSRRATLATLALFAQMPAPAPARAEKRLRVGITLHPDYSWVANIAGD